MNVEAALARHRLKRAREALAEAELLAGAGRWNGALNRIYYASYYAARALLALRHVDASRHAGVITLFQEHYVKPGIIATDVARALPQAFAKRQRSDYGDYADAEESEVRTLTGQVDRLIAACEEYVARPIS